MITPTFHLIGLPTDCNSSFARGAAAGPQAIRTALWSDRGNLAAEDGQEIGHDFLLEDLGDLTLTETVEDDTVIRNAVADSLDAGAIPLMLGGDLCFLPDRPGDRGKARAGEHPAL